MTRQRVDDDPKYICCDCIKEEFLSGEIENQGKRRKCSFCKNVQRTYFVSDIADRVENVMLSFYEQPTRGQLHGKRDFRPMMNLIITGSEKAVR